MVRSFVAAAIGFIVYQMRHAIILKAICTLSPTSRRSCSGTSNYRPLLKFRGGSIPITNLSSTTFCNMTTSTSDSSTSMYTYEDKEQFESLCHPGYSTESHAQFFSGGWLAHRANIKDDGSCWVKKVGPKLTVSALVMNSNF